MVTTVYMQGTTQELVRIGDSTAGAGNFEIYLNPKTILHHINFPLIIDVATGFDFSKGASFGESELIYTFQECTMDVGGAAGNGEKLIRALYYWSVNNSLLNLDVKDKDGYDRAVFSNHGSTGVSAIQCRVMRLSPIKEGPDNYIFNVTVKRFTS